MADTDIHLRPVTQPDQLQSCVTLYETVFHLGPGDGSLNTRLLVGLVNNSGLVIGAFNQQELVGFTLSFLARDSASSGLYHYSQLALVGDDFQGRGIGRQLKLAQRAAVLAQGVDELRWAFDPFQTRNAHFNLSVLGARAVSCHRNYYGPYAHGLDAAATTDRLIAVWDLKAAAADEVVRQTLVVPAEVSRHLSDDDRQRRRAVLDAFDDYFARGLVARGCEMVSTGEARYDFGEAS